jgi:hypothetical protein
MHPTDEQQRIKAAFDVYPGLLLIGDCLGETSARRAGDRFHVSRRPSETAGDRPQPCQSVSIGAQLSRR